jgi:hypothetical protein
MYFKVLADLVVLIHFLWILFLIFGSFWGARSRAVKICHVSGLVFAFIIQVFDWYCPLTYLEAWLRAQQDPSLTYRGSFIITYLEKIVYIELSPAVIAILTIVLCVFTTWFYLRKKNASRGR